MTNAEVALEALKEGNQRYAAGAELRSTENDPAERASRAGQHRPPAIVLGCSDARVPAELVFDQRPGDLFVIRVAGNVATPTQIGSVEFAAQALGARLVVVLGHSGCGAVNATLDALRDPSLKLSPHLQAIVECIRPALAPLLAGDSGEDPAGLPQRAVQANVRAVVGALQRESEVVAGLIRDEGLRIVGAQYALDTGVVEFLDEIQREFDLA